MKILHLTFHQGAADCVRDMIWGDADLTTQIVPATRDNYNISHELAETMWGIYKGYYNSFDCVITTDTALLSRPFLQNNYKGKLIIWICNRFDYWDGGGKPDKEYYDLMKDAMSRKNVTIIGYTPFEQIYCIDRGIYVEDVVKLVRWPREYVKSNLYYIPDYQNNHTFDVAKRCGLPVKTGRHSGMEELGSFKAVIHLPYHWQGVAEMDALSVRTPYYVPTKRLFLELMNGDYWFQNKEYCSRFIDVCNFYDKRNDFIYYFDSLDGIPEIEYNVSHLFSIANDVYDDNRNKLGGIIWK